MDIPKLYYIKVTENAFDPVKGSYNSAGFDLKSAYNTTVPKRDSRLISTDLQIQLPSGTYGRIAPRSGLATLNKIDIGGGVIDGDYRGIVGVILFNHNDEEFIIDKGDRIAQIICEKIEYPELVLVETLTETARGACGFGSTDEVQKDKKVGKE